jgi:hypothetical protein
MSPVYYDANYTTVELSKTIKEGGFTIILRRRFKATAQRGEKHVENLPPPRGVKRDA